MPFEAFNAPPVPDKNFETQDSEISRNILLENSFTNPPLLQSRIDTASAVLPAFELVNQIAQGDNGKMTGKAKSAAASEHRSSQGSSFSGSEKEVGDDQRYVPLPGQLSEKKMHNPTYRI